MAIRHSARTQAADRQSQFKAGLCGFFSIQAFPRTKAGVKAELHICSKGSHGYDLGTGRGKSLAIWPESFVAGLIDSSMIPQ